MNPPVIQPPAAAPCVPVEQPALAVVLRLESPGAILAREPVRPDDLATHVAEAWREGCLRKGHPDVPLSDVSVWLRPLLKPGQILACAGFTLETRMPDVEPMATSFANRSLDLVARRTVQRLLKTGRLKDGQPYCYEIHFQPGAESALPANADEIDFETTDHSPALTWLEVPLRPLLEQSAPRNTMDEDAFHVFFTAGAFGRAEQFARKGANASPPVETGAALAGVVCSCPITGDLFVVVTDAYEVMAAEQKAYSIELSHESWRRILNTIRARHARCPALRLLGQAHGHNFLPAGGQTCEACPTRTVCDLTNVFASEDDENWTRAHFAGQPWSIGAIFGFSARGDRLHEIFTQHNARLRRRGYFVIPDFKPDQWPCRNATADLGSTAPSLAQNSIKDERPPSPQPSPAGEGRGEGGPISFNSISNHNRP